ncbi:hypothetical protein [Caulobacter sp. UNC279MFTsu5.1]|uniref:hypothetical protein n=1 Tax=Caulobacter sp. UNC279MFTsu5.1 TaxID=1502775 RepID=UPI000674E373|nr:hypothetical protein [Caulobacter sp. UNC279MFTsu5.1]SFI90125.1 hypothetical protein SAMN02799626_00727 [Caulobacter sp. UNC279MFTsu5.1]
MRTEVRAKRVWRSARRATRLLLPPKPTLPSLEGKLLASAWTLMALTTLSVALAQGLRMFLLSALAVLFGTLAALWMLDGQARR